MNSIHDPIGLLAPLTVRAKILLRKIWALEPKVEWDDDLPRTIEEEWFAIYNEISGIEKISFTRSLTPIDAFGLPWLIIFSDGSKLAYGAVAYCRWQLTNGKFRSYLIMAKSKIAPLKTIDIVRLELSGAVISKRIRTYIEKEMKLQFEKVYHIVDSESVKAMIDKESYGYNTFIANCVGEIHQVTSQRMD